MIVVAGISFSSAGFEQLARFTGNFSGGSDMVDGIAGQVWLQTCNRLELYAELENDDPQLAEKILLQAFGLRQRPEGWYICQEEAAVFHLLKVAAGLESAILGEDQILGQLRLAFQHAAENRMTTSFLNKVFHKAFATGKQVRRLTAINKGHQSVASIAVSLADGFARRNQLGKTAEILLLGAGETGNLLTEILVDKEYRNIRIWNRTSSRSIELASRFDLQVVSQKELLQAYRQADIVLIATSAKKALLPYHSGPLKKQRLLIDLSMPFQVDPQPAIPGTILYNLTQIADIRQETQQNRNRAVQDALQLVYAAREEVMSWKEEKTVSQTMQQWKYLLDRVRQRSLKAFLKAHPGASENELETYGRQLMSQVMNQLGWTVRQQQLTDEGSQWSRLLSNVEPYEQLN